MRISLTLFGQWPLTKKLTLPSNMSNLQTIENAYLTSTRKDQSLKDTLYDGALFHLFKKLNHKIVLMVQCDEKSPEYKLLQSFKDDVDVFVEFENFKENEMEIQKYKQDEHIFICTVYTSYPSPEVQNMSQEDDLKRKLNDFVIQNVETQKCSQVLENIYSTLQDTFFICLSYHTSECKDSIWQVSSKSFALLPHKLINMFTNNNNILTYLIQQSDIDIEMSDLVPMNSNSCLTIHEHESEETQYFDFKILKDSQVFTIVQDFEKLENIQAMESFLVKTLDDEVLDPHSDDHTLIVAEFLKILKEFIRRRTNIDEFFENFTENEEVREDIPETPNFETEETHHEEKEIEPAQLVEEIQSEEIMEEEEYNSEQNDLKVLVPATPSDTASYITQNNWKENLRSQVKLRCGNDKLENLDVLLKSLEEGLPYTIIIGSDGISQALHGALPPTLLQTLISSSNMIQLPTHDGKTTRLYGNSTSPRVGRVTLDVNSMFLVDQVLVYNGQAKIQKQAKTPNESMENKTYRGSVMKFARRIELNRLMSHK